ncbi:MAG: indole-3-glycerol-phosphate synthase [Acidobacteriota bacterium]|nr:indole-3-glycerol-phosphate synthase [Acidobacteriota bacterium]MDQ7087965.1 indole-3-glycerol-phosphate synthase [Acidobacteriota bacterium]
MSGFLARMAESARRRARRLHAGGDRGSLEARALGTKVPPPPDLGGGGFDLVAEIKPRSPSEGSLAATLSVSRAAARARLYEGAGAVAISVLTEPESFGGSLEMLGGVAAATALPVMRKDFLVDPLQVLEARAWGAAGVLLIVRMLPGDLFGEMLDAADRVGLFCLVEAFDEQDLERVAALTAHVGTLLVGINCRNLETLAVEPTRFERLAPRAPGSWPLVAESGVSDAGGAAAVARMGYRGLLAGTALMRAVDPAVLIEDMLAAGRREARG